MKGCCWRILSDFYKNHIQRIANESIRTRLKKRIVQADTDNNLSVMNEINYDYARTNNKGIILPLESLWINTIPKIESLMIKFKNIDENGNKKIYFSRNRLPIIICCRRKACIHRSKMNIMHLLKIFLDTKKYFLIV